MADFSCELPAGKYVVCDPCYCFEHETGTWERVLEAINRAKPSPLFVFDGKQLVFFQAEHVTGDGFMYPVDSSSFGIVPLELVESEREWLLKEETIQLGESETAVRERGALLVESDTPVRVVLDGNVLFVGQHEFDLGGDWE